MAVAQIPKIHLRDLEDPLGGGGVVKLRLGTLGTPIFIADMRLKSGFHRRVAVGIYLSRGIKPSNTRVTPIWK